MDQALLGLLKSCTSVSLQFNISIKEVRQVQKLYLFVTTWMTPFFRVNLCPPQAVLCSVCPSWSLCNSDSVRVGTAVAGGVLAAALPCLSRSAVQPEAISFFFLFPCYFWCTQGCVVRSNFLPCGLYAEQTVPLCRSSAKDSLLLLLNLVLSEVEMVARPQQALCTQLGLLAAHLLGLGSTRFSQTAEVCAINERH